MVVIASGRRAGADPTAGRPWSVRSLALAFAAAAVLTVISVSNLDVAVKSQLAAVRVEAGARALALAPPRSADGPNAAPIYRRAFAALTPTDQLPELLRDKAQAWRGYDREAFDPADREQEEFLEGQQARAGPAPRGGGGAPVLVRPRLVERHLAGGPAAAGAAPPATRRHPARLRRPGPGVPR